MLTAEQKRRGVRSSYIGSEVFLGLVDSAHAPFSGDLRQLSIQTLCTNRDLALTIEGRAVKLPAKSYLHAQLAATFTWTHGDQPAARETVPAGAGGLDVVFRD